MRGCHVTRALLTLRVPWCTWQTEKFTQGHLVPICWVGSHRAGGGGRGSAWRVLAPPAGPGCPPGVADHAGKQSARSGTNLFSLPKFMAAFPWDLAPDAAGCVREGISRTPRRTFLQHSGSPYQAATSSGMLYVITASTLGSH